MAQFKIFRETALPGTLQPYAMYIIAPAAKPDYIEIYVTNAGGNLAKRIINQDDIQALINSAIAGLSTLYIVDDIAARNALAPSSNIQCYVIDATADGTVASGGATYIYRLSATAWIKISEAESLDLVLNWSTIQGKPSSSPSAIDSAVTNSHSHSNKTQLDKVGENGSGQLTYNGNLPVIGWDTATW